MPDPNLIYRMTAYMAWADDVMLRTAEKVPLADVTRAQDTLFSSVAGTFDHVLVVAEIFKAHIEGRSHPHTARHRSETLSFPQIASGLRTINSHFVSLAHGWTEDDLAQQVHFEFVGGGQGCMTQESILLHLVNHATYHRGFVSTLLFPYKLDGGASDLTVFMRDVWPDILATREDESG